VTAGHSAAFDLVIWATDGSENADLALEYAVKLARSRLLAVHVKEMGVGRSAGYPVHVDEEEREQKVRRQVDELKDAGVDVELELAAVASGGAAHVIADIARDVGADVVVVGTRGQGLVAGLLLGSVTHRLLHVAPCPVLAVPSRSALDDAEGT
jgi:nucleotide-binding universal stress UspA family protein